MSAAGRPNGGGDKGTDGSPQRGKEPLIFEIKGNSLDDGPGIRTVVFFKGCPLSCLWCHNPEGMRSGAELSFDPAECVGCGECLEVCPSHALDRANPGFIDRERCDLCFRCVEACPAQALARVGRRMAVAEIVAEVAKDIPFFRTSGGGVTLSGGEPTLYMDFASRLLRELKRLGVSCLIETCGYFDLARFDQAIYPHIDLIYYDLKLFDEGEHRKYCGVSNQRILDNFSMLLRRCLEGGVPVLPRVPLVPGITATERNLAAIARFLRESGAGEVALLPYNPLWLEKSEKVGAAYPFRSDRSKASWMKADEVDWCRSFFRGMTVI